MALRVVSLPATASSTKNEVISSGVSMSSSRLWCTSFDVRSFVGFWRRSSISSPISAANAMPASSSLAITSPSPTYSGSPPPRMTLVASRTVLNSLRGIPIMSQMISSGYGCDSTSTRSASPCSQNPSITSVQMDCTESSTPASSVGVKLCATIRR